MAKTDKSTEKPGTKTPKAEKTAKQPKLEAKAEVVQPLKVEITFPSIMDLKQALAFDADGNLVIALQFKARVDQYEIFRLVNLLKQPHGALYATIGTLQSAMDFHFDAKAGKVEIIQAAKALPPGKAESKKAGKPADQVIETLEEMKLRDKYKVIVGGGPVTQEWADQIGADGYGKDAAEAVKLARSFLSDIRIPK